MKKISNYILYFLVLIEPFLDTYFMYNSPCMEFLGFKLSTIIRYGLLALIFILLFINTKFKKNRKMIISYALIILLYIGLHHYTAIHFKSLIPGDFNYSLKEELFYIARYMFPLVIVYYMSNADVSKKDFKRILVIYSLIVSLSIIISNIFLISRSSYYEYNISYNIIDWFRKDISYATASTRGFFYATIVMTPLLLITPYIYNLYYKEGKYIYLTTIVCNMLALFMAGTKACTFGFVIVAVTMLLSYLFFTLIKKEMKLNIGRLLASIAIVALCFAIVPKSPAVQRISLTNNMYKGTENDKKDIETNKKPSATDKPNTITNEKDLGKVNISNYKNFEEIYYLKDEHEREKAIKKYILENTKNLGIASKFFVKAYSYLYDYNFWADFIIKENPEHKANARYVQTSIFNRIKQINDNSLDDLFGISYSRTSKIFNLERDFLYQYYSLGIIGVILFLGPIVALLGFCIGRILLKKEKFNLENTSLCLGIGLLLCVALYSGNMLDNLGITILLGFVLGYLYKNMFLNENAN